MVHGLVWNRTLVAFLEGFEGLGFRVLGFRAFGVWVWVLGV